MQVQTQTKNAVKDCKKCSQAETKYSAVTEVITVHHSVQATLQVNREDILFEPGIPGFVKFFDPYVYREAINFESEEEATNFYLTKLREQIFTVPDSVAAIVMETTQVQTV